MAKDRLESELLSQYVADYGDIRDDDPNGWPLSVLKDKIQSIINNPDLRRGNPPPIRPRISTVSHQKAARIQLGAARQNS
jgi:hypothetical protein